MQSRGQWNSVLRLTVVAAFIFNSGLTYGTTAPVSVILENGPHHRVWQTVSEEKTDAGPVSSTNSYVELQTGLNRLTEKGWVETSPTIELSKDGAIAGNLQYRVTFAPNLNSPGAVQIVLIDGQKLSGQPVSIIYADAFKSVTLAEVGDCAAEIGGANQNELTYKEAFPGIDVKYIVQRDRFSQELIFKQRLPSPAELGLNENAQLIVITEWASASAPQLDTRLWREAAPGGLALTDQAIGFGPMEFIVGKAFSLGDAASPSAVPVARGWEQIDGRTFLLEKVVWKDIAAELEKLPPSQAGVLKNLPDKHEGPLLAKAALPSLRVRRPALRPVQFARTQSRFDAGFLWDYVFLSTASGVVLKSDTTYYVSAPVNLSGTTTIEGGTVVKYTNASSAQIWITGSGAKVNCLTAPYKPAWFTAKDDDSVGEKINTSTGTVPPGSYYASQALYLDYLSSGVLSSLSHLRIRYAQYAIDYNGGAGHSLSHSQLIRCESAVVPASSDVSLRNVLIDACYTDIRASGTSTVRGENLTITDPSAFNIGSATVFLTNCLLTGFSTQPAYTGPNNTVLGSSSGVYQTVGAGGRYLAAGSPYRNAGTTVIQPALLADLRTRTTYPPMEYLCHFTIPTIISVGCVPRDVDAIDLGYHYEPLDAAWGGRNLSSTLLLTNGAAVAIYGSTGITLQSGAQFISEGSPTNLNHIVRFQAVQENPTWGTTAATMSLFNIVANPATAPQVFLRFTEVALLADTKDKRNLLDAAQYRLSLSLQDCVLRNTYIYVVPTDHTQTKSVSLTNNLMQRTYCDLSEAYSGSGYPVNLQLRNNLFLYGTVSLTYLNSYYGTWAVYDNLFDTVSLTATVLDPYNNPLPNDYNGYISTTQLSSSPNNKTVSTRDYASGPLGTNYYPQTGNNLNQLNGAGSRTAALAGLYRYTVRVDQNEEAGATHAAIGCHYVALNGYGLAKDYDSDGLPDYFEDRNGNGSYDMAQGETKVDNPDTNGDGKTDFQNWQLASLPAPQCDTQVNDPAQDAGVEQNTQSETAVIAYGNTVIAAFVDSNLGVAGYGLPSPVCTDNNYNPIACPAPTNLVRFTGWSVSFDGGMTFTDKGVPPTNNTVIDSNYIFGSSVGDPVLARDTTANIVYLLANPKRPSVFVQSGQLHHYAPLWLSYDNGQTFQQPINATPGLTEVNPYNYLDKPAIAVDNYSGTSQGQGNVYLAYQLGDVSKIYFYRSGPGATTLINTAQLGSSAFAAQIVVAPNQTQNHPVYVVWRELGGTQVYFKASKSTDQGVTFSSVVPILTANGGPSTPTDLQLRRSDNSSADDYFRTPIIPIFAVNPINGDLYLVYTDKSITTGDNADIFFVQSTDGGNTWTGSSLGPFRVNSDNPTASKDQWQPAITVKPDGTKLFIAWYDRREDAANNSTIRTYGVFIDLPITGASSFSAKQDFPISSGCFPPAFTGTSMTSLGQYDPAYPPNVPVNDTRCCSAFQGTYAAHMGDYDIAASDNNYVYYTWGDNRISCTFHGQTRYQADVRFARIPWSTQ